MYPERGRWRRGVVLGVTTAGLGATPAALGVMAVAGIMTTVGCPTGIIGTTGCTKVGTSGTPAVAGGTRTPVGVAAPDLCFISVIGSI